MAEHPRAVVAMSGGVDSSVAALLMLERGYDCIGVTMKLFNNEDAGIPRERTCCSLEDMEDARNVCYALGIRHYACNFSREFRARVIDRFVAEYARGATPNPCIDCNRHLKFDRLYRCAAELDFDCVATGHYARIERDAASGRYLLRKARDASKDQSYVLYALTQDQLARAAFPLGELSKAEVRKIAEFHGFRNARKRDSQDICFVPEGSYADFIERSAGHPFPPGNFIDRQGHILGRHEGIIHYTVGQRKGLGLALGKPMYVARIDPVRNEVVLGEDAELYTRKLTARDINLIAVPRLDRPLRVKAKIRYRQSEQWAIAVQTGEDELEVTFDEPQRAVTPGQAVVLYDGDFVIGGGTIQ